MAFLERELPCFLVMFGCFLAGWVLLFVAHGVTVVTVALPDTYTLFDAFQTVMVSLVPAILLGAVTAALLVVINSYLGRRLSVALLLPVGLLAGAGWALVLLLLGISKMAGFGKLPDSERKIIEVALIASPFLLLGVLKLFTHMRTSRVGAGF